jgi:HAD superfamily hydrolase (TIGR01458 family)
MGTPPVGIVLDMEGVIHVAYTPLPGAADAIARLDAAGIGLAILTNTTSKPRSAIADRLVEMGIDFPADRIVSAASATVAYLQHEYPDARVLLLGEPGAYAEVEESGGLRLVERGSEADVVCLGGPDDALTWTRLQEAFRALMAGAAFVAMQRNRWWPTADGPGLDAGCFVAGLEYSSGRTAHVVGKPSADVYRAALGLVGAAPDEGMMVGDDPEADLGTASAIGMRTCLVRTGKGASFPTPYPDATLDLPALADLPGALGV